MLINIVLIIHLVVTVAIVGLILLQQGKGSDMGAVLGGGSQSVFGARGSANFLSRSTALLAAVFFFTSLFLAYLYSNRAEPESVIATTPAVQQDTTVEPAQPSDAVPAAENQASGTQTETQNSDVPAVPEESNNVQQSN